MIVEDEVFVVLDLEDALRSVSIDIGGSFATNAASLEWLETHQPHVAVIDYRLGDGTSEPLALALTAKAIPFVVYSGNAFEPGVHGGAFDGVQWIDKPAALSVLTSAVKALVAL